MPHSSTSPASPPKRPVDIVVISDVHLGTYGCHATELEQYLQSIAPKMVVLNGDIIDIWQFSKRYWPASHTRVIKRLVSLISKEIPVYYITGNHDEMLRRYTDFRMGSFVLTNKLLIEVEGKKTWIFHGDVFDVSMQYSKWLARLGGKGYDLLILLNRAVNFISRKMGRGRISLSKRIKDSVKKAVKFVGDYEATAAGIAIENGYDTVICGHIHQPQDRRVTTDKGQVHYLNSGDWVENLTALEYYEGQWHIYRYEEDPAMKTIPTENDAEAIHLPGFEWLKEQVTEPAVFALFK